MSINDIEKKKEKLIATNDPIINSYINDYTKEEKEYLRGEKLDNELLINFNITYNQGCDEASKDIEQNNSTIKEYEKFYKKINVSEDKKIYNGEEIPKRVHGIIKVKSVLSKVDGEPIKGLKINLYVTNGVSPRLIKSAITNDDGIVVFKNIECGNYRVIEIINKAYFEKPIYKKWNEVNISNDNTYEEVIVINRVKNVYKSNNSD